MVEPQRAPPPAPLTYDQAVADRLATFDWLEAHGYEVPESFREK